MIDSVIERVVEILLSGPAPLTSRRIADEIGMSESSVRHKMGQVRALIDSCEGDASLRSAPGRGFWIQGDANDRAAIVRRLEYDRDHAGSSAYRRDYILRILAHPRSNYTMRIFADDLCVSRGTIETDLRGVDRWLESLGIELSKTPNIGVRIRGSEAAVCEAMIQSAHALFEGRGLRAARPDDLDLRVSATSPAIWRARSRRRSRSSRSWRSWASRRSSRWIDPAMTWRSPRF